MNVEAFSGGVFAENGYIAWCAASKRAVVVDPGAAAEGIVTRLEALDLAPEAVLLTHAHLDHLEGVPRVRDAWPDVPVLVHAADLPLYRAVAQQAAAFGVAVGPMPEPEATLEHGQKLQYGGTLTFEVRYTPGHAPGHVIFVASESGLALVGDVVFQGSIGRTDLPGGDYQALMTSIRQEVLTLPDQTRLLTGHGPETTVGHERMGNPFLVPDYLGHFA